MVPLLLFWTWRAAGGDLAIIEWRRAIADQRLVDEVRAAALLELGLGGGDQVGAREELSGGERERLGSDDRALDPDAGAARGGRLPGVRRGAGHPGRGVERRQRCHPAHVAGIGRGIFLTVELIAAE